MYNRCKIPPNYLKAIRHLRRLQSKILVIFHQLKHLYSIHNHQVNKENNPAQQNNTMRQPSSRGSPLPRGYIHQPICSFYFFIKKLSAYKNHGSFMAGFIFPQGSTQRDNSPL